MEKVNVFWFRRDLRLDDNAGLFHALSGGEKVVPIFIFDTKILSKLEDIDDARMTFLHETISHLKLQLQELGSDLLVFYGEPYDIWSQLIKRFSIGTVFYNHDYESYAIERDNTIVNMLLDHQINSKSFKDHVIFEKEEVVKDDGNPYTVFTPYKKKWLSKLADKGDVKASFYFKSYPSGKKLKQLASFKEKEPLISLEEMGFEKSDISIPNAEVMQSTIKNYDVTRDFPALDATSKLGIHFRFGTISIRQKALKAVALNDTFLSELIWRDFYAMILYHFPHVEKNSFRPEYDQINWLNNEREFMLWCEGKTGYPIVDAGMRQLKQTGYMHNRVRMITASFLTKHLLIDWRWGEAWFARHLLDFDLASNSGGWQWAAGCGTDAAPYFRIFSPDAQTERFDKDKKYIKKWVSEYGTSKYVAPIVDHKMARERCLQVYKIGLGKG
jgi:deoxyribodipyrimidine photo-lyase